ncbi:MAG: hypothetical protein IJV04_10615 [Lachnospiraceae bacterium]|nr:hypothetical protein [Lachnospiraceae bacterium]
MDNENGYMVAEIMRGRRRAVFLFEIEKSESLEQVVEKNFGPTAEIVVYRKPTMEEFILMKRGMKT